MKINFNLMKCGLGNNGGSQTIVKTANKLSEFGHDVKIVDTIENKHTWNKLKVPHLIIKDLNYFPSGDIVVATGFNTVSSTVLLSKRCGIKCHWIRGWETWNTSEEDIYNKILKQPTHKIVNGKNIFDKLKSYNIKSVIIRPGVDDDLYFDNNTRDENEFIIGGLYNTKHKSKNSQLIIDVVAYLKLLGIPVKLYMFGTDKKINSSIVDLYLQHPTHEQKNNLYNKCNLWFAPTTNDSLHIPPMEALLTNCPILAFDLKMNGMTDYLIDGKNSIIIKYNLSVLEIGQIIINNIDKLKNSKLNYRDDIINLIGNRDTNISKLEEYFEFLTLV